MQLTHKIALIPTSEQAVYFGKAAGTSRRVWNWALGEWNKQRAAGKKSNAMALKKSFNKIKYQQFPWLKEMHRDSHAQPFTYLGKAWDRFFKEIKAKKPAHEPKFKKKNKCRDSFYVANDKFSINEKIIRLPKIGNVAMREKLRFTGKILGATVSRQANRWFVAIQVDVPDSQAKKPRRAHETIGVDLGVKIAATLSTGESIAAPTPLKSALRRIKIRGRSVSRKIKSAKETLGFNKNAKLPRDTKLPVSNNRKKSSLQLAKLHARVAHLRADFTHKLTTQLCRDNQAIVIEDLHVSGMLKNEKLARSISDVGFSTLRRQLEYKSLRYDNQLIIADRWYPSSKLCSMCNWKNESLTLSDREWQCQNCGVLHDRDLNAAINLKRLADETALPVASQLVTDGTAIEEISIAGGKVTPFRYECGQQDTSGEERNREHISSHF